MQQNKLYREEALKRISSPDQLNGYIRTSRSSVWFVLGAILLVLVGILVWGFTGSFEVTMEARGGTYEGKSACFIHPSERNDIEAGMQVLYMAPDKSTHTGFISTIGDRPLSYAAACERFSIGLMNRIGFTPGSELYVAELILNDNRKNEFATVKIIRDVIKPSELLFTTK